MRRRPQEGEADSGSRVVRGGSWNNNNTENFRCANRNNNDPGKRNNNNGFRCASTFLAGVQLSTDSRGVPKKVQAASWPGMRPGRIPKRGQETGSLMMRTSSAPGWSEKQEARSKEREGLIALDFASDWRFEVERSLTGRSKAGSAGIPAGNMSKCQKADIGKRKPESEE